MFDCRDFKRSSCCTLSSGTIPFMVQDSLRHYICSKAALKLCNCNCKCSTLLIWLPKKNAYGELTCLAICLTATLSVPNRGSPVRGQDLAAWSALRIILSRNLPSTSHSWKVRSQMSWNRMSSSDTPLGEKLTNFPTQPDTFSGLLR